MNGQSLVATLPIVQGGATEARRREYKSASMMYSLEKEDTSRRLVQAMLSSSLEVTTAFSNIFIDRRAATASENNLKLLTEQYTRESFQ